MRILPRQRTIHLLRGDVFHFEEHVQDVLALAGQLELMLREVVLQDFDVPQIFAHGSSHLVSDNEY